MTLLPLRHSEMFPARPVTVSATDPSFLRKEVSGRPASSLTAHFSAQHSRLQEHIVAYGRLSVHFVSKQ